jgi:flagellar biosynthesis GTPase FlhF
VSTTAPNPAQLARTGRRIAGGIWVCATITMAASLVNGTSVFDALTIGALGVVVGFLTSLAVDACLVVVLIGDRQMQALGLVAGWGRVMRIVTLGMSLALNCGASVVTGHHFLAVFHAFLPLLIFGMSEYGQQVMLRFAAEIRRQVSERAETEAAQRRAQQVAVDAENAKRQQVADEEDGRRRLEAHQRTLTAEAKRTAEETERQAVAAERLREATEKRAEVAREVLTSKPHLVVDNTRKSTVTTAASVGEQAQAWLTDQHRAGVNYQEIGPAEIAKAIGAKYETCKSRHRAWKSAVARELDLIAELAEAAG